MAATKTRVFVNAVSDLGIGLAETTEKICRTHVNHMSYWQLPKEKSLLKDSVTTLFLAIWFPQSLLGCRNCIEKQKPE